MMESRENVVVETEAAHAGSPRFQERLEANWEEPKSAANTGCIDRDTLQGTWLTVSGRRSAEFLLAGSHFAVRFEDGPIYMGTFDLDAGVFPKVMDMRIDEGPQQHRWKTTRCIYEVDGDTLRWCAGQPGKMEVPADFPLQDEQNRLYLVLKRK